MHPVRALLVLATALALGLAPAGAQTPTDDARQAIDRGLDYLRAQQKPDGSWQGDKDPPAVTALVLRAFVLDEKHPSKTDFVARGFDKLLSYQTDAGGIYKDLLANYNTAIAISALAAAKDPAFRPSIDRAVAYLKGLQWTPNMTSAEGQTVTGEDDPWFGGWGYGGRSRGGGRPDLSNASFAIDALRDAGLKPSDPAFQNALKFVTRLQNSSETNTAAWASDDGGFVYGPSDNKQGESMAGEYTDAAGRRLLRSYGSMTYAGLKSMIYAGLSKDDPRVRAAWRWISQNWTLDENPGMKLNKPDAAQYGLYYYYLTLARALNAYDQPIITTPEGTRHDWRVELIEKLSSLQKPDGSWSGDKRWMEDNPVLVTSYAVTALHEALADLKEHPAE